MNQSGSTLYRLIGNHAPALATAFDTPIHTPPKDLSCQETSKPDFKSFVRQLAILVALKASGFDPDVRMDFIAHYVGESRATLYRKMGLEFPLATKRGRSSFWPLSAIDAYKAAGSNTNGKVSTEATKEAAHE